MEFKEPAGDTFSIIEPPAKEAPKTQLVVEPIVKEEKANTETSKEEVKAETVVVPDKTPALQEEKLQEQVKPDFNALIGEATKGAIKTPEELTQRLTRLQELEETVKQPKYKNAQEEKIANFLAEYPGQDYGTGFQAYLKLQSLDVKSLDPTTAIKESMILDNLKLGLSASEAEQLANDEIERKYADDSTDLYKKRDAVLAKQKLETLQVESKAPKADPQQEQQRLQQEAYQKRQEDLRSNYLNEVDGYFKKAPEPSKIKLSDNASEDLTFKAFDAKDQKGLPIKLRPMVENYNSEVVAGRYGVKNEKNEVTGFNAALIAQDLEKIFSFEARVKEAFEHGLNIGVERYIKSRTNSDGTVKTNNALKSDAPTGGTFTPIPKP
jgi:hypothetical protein